LKFYYQKYFTCGKKHCITHLTCTKCICEFLCCSVTREVFFDNQKIWISHTMGKNLAVLISFNVSRHNIKGLWCFIRVIINYAFLQINVYKSIYKSKAMCVCYCWTLCMCVLCMCLCFINNISNLNMYVLKIEMLVF
jgi:hypothetical protein